MNLVKCANGHFYNAKKLPCCPHCANEEAGVFVEDLTGAKQDSIDTAIPKQQLPEKYQRAAASALSGWLVCIDGAMRGDSFTLYTGTSRIGRDASMDVVLFREPTVSRICHALITYKPEDTSFTMSVPAGAASPVYLNGQLMKAGHSATLSSHDRITLGECVLVFVPFCGEAFRWM